MNTHFTEADLLETYYTEPGQSMPVMMHLASCRECTARYERLERKLREAASCDVERPETFWSRQRISVMRRIAQTRPQAFSVARTMRVAAAASLAFVLTGAVFYEVSAPRPETAAVVQPVPARPAIRGSEPAIVAHDAWQSDELEDFHTMVAWESWVEPENGGRL